jgi:outer membrane lipoprotein SlyB
VALSAESLLLLVIFGLPAISGAALGGIVGLMGGFVCRRDSSLFAIVGVIAGGFLGVLAGVQLNHQVWLDLQHYPH